MASRSHFYLRVIAVLFVLLPLSAAAQSSLTLTGEAGPGYLGNRHPHLNIGLEGSFTVWNRFTSTTEFSVSPDQKIFAESGHGLGVGERITTRITDHVGLRTGVGYSVYWSGIPIGSNCPKGNKGPNGPDGQQCITTFHPYHKGGVNPYIGIEIKYALSGLPGGVLSIDYLPKTGDMRLERYIKSECVFASRGNPCPITSPQIQGIIAEQYFEMAPRFSFGVRGGWIRYGDQVNPNAPQLGQVRHNTRFATFVLRYHLLRKDDYIFYSASGR